MKVVMTTTTMIMVMMTMMSGGGDDDDDDDEDDDDHGGDDGDGYGDDGDDDGGGERDEGGGGEIKLTTWLTCPVQSPLATWSRLPASTSRRQVYRDWRPAHRPTLLTKHKPGCQPKVDGAMERREKKKETIAAVSIVSPSSERIPESATNHSDQVILFDWNPMSQYL